MHRSGGIPATVLLGTGDPRWTEYLSRVRHDMYHLPEYAAFATRHQDPGEPLLFVAEDGEDLFLLPLVVRSISAEPGGTGLSDAVSPRIYAGPLMSAASDRAPGGFVDRAIEALSATLRDRGVVSVFVRVHPLLSTPLGPFDRAGTVVEHGDAVWIDLTLTPDEMWGQTRHSHRRHINAAIRDGYTVRMDDDWERLPEFAAAYRESMDRLDAIPFWRLTLDYFEDLHRSIGNRLHLCVVEHADGFAAGALIAEVDGLAEYHLAGTMNADVSASPSKLIIDFVRRWARERGDRVFHLAGSLQRGDALNHFKLGFSPLQQPVCTWRLVTDGAAYERLCQGWEATSKKTRDPDTQYFPAYRKPIQDTV